MTDADVIPLRPGQALPSPLADPLAAAALALVAHLQLVPRIKESLATEGVLLNPDATDSSALATALAAAIWGWTRDELARASDDTCD